MCRFCIEYKDEKDIWSGIHTMDAADKVNKSIRELENSLLLFADKVEGRNVAAYIKSYHKKTIKMRKQFNESYFKGFFPPTEPRSIGIQQ